MILEVRNYVEFLFLNLSHQFGSGWILPINHLHSCPLVYQNVHSTFLYSYFHSPSEMVQDSYLHYHGLYYRLGYFSSIHHIFTMVRNHRQPKKER